MNKNLFVTIDSCDINVINGFKYEDNNYCVISNSFLYDRNYNDINLIDIINYYEKNIELANVIMNNFTIIIVDKKNKKIITFQDLNGDIIPVYYYKNSNKLVFSNLLENIIPYIVSPTINMRVISLFMKKGYINSNNTLIKEIYKLTSEHNLIIDLNNFNNFKFVKKKIKFNKIDNYNTDLYVKEFKKIISVTTNGKKVFTTLSNGYDSNFIHALLQDENYIEAFSIGGISGRDETKFVKKNVEKFPNTNLNVSLVSKKTLDNYPDLVYKLGGFVYEQGIFLQYELMKCIEKKVSADVVLISGEGSDEIFSLQYYNKVHSLYKNIRYLLFMFQRKVWKDEIKNFNIKGGFLYGLNYKNTLSNVVVKKNGILMNNINIDCVHPYLFRNIIDIAYTNRYKNIRKKISHIQACDKIIDSSILRNIKHLGGTTEPIALFENCNYIEEIKLIVNNSKYNILKIDNKVSNNYLDYLLKVLYLEIFEYIYIKNNSDIEKASNKKLIDILKDLK